MKGYRKLLALLLIMLMLLCSCGNKTDEAKLDVMPETNGVASSVGAITDLKETSTSIADAAGGEALTAPTAESGSVSTAGRVETAPADFIVDGFTSDGVMDFDGFSVTDKYSDAVAKDDSLFEGLVESEGDDYGLLEEFVVGDPGDGPDVIIDDVIIDEPYTNSIQPGAHMLTAGEWNDNKNFGFIMNLVRNGQDYDYASFFKNWSWRQPMTRLTVACSNGNTPVENANVAVYTENGDELWRGKTDNSGLCYCFYNLTNEEKPYKVVVEKAGESKEQIFEKGLAGDAYVNMPLENASNAEKKLEVMYMIDTTGSMGDEITFLQCELANVIERVRTENGNLPISLSVNFYRDKGDDYVVRSNPFSTDIDGQVALLMREYASGGGDWEEAVDEALNDAVTRHMWSEDATKILFLVLDAPPHNRQDVIDSLSKILPVAAEKGIRIIPVAASGIDKDTEFLLRTFAMVTGGTYTFLTNDSGIGGAHIEATVGAYEVEYLNDLMVRVIGEYLQNKEFVAQDDYGLEGGLEQPVVIIDDDFVQ